MLKNPLQQTGGRNSADLHLSKSGWIIRCDARGEGHPSEELEALLWSHPDLTAVFMLNSDALMEALFALKRLDASVPEDFSLVSWDDCDIVRFLNLTVVQQPVTEMGALAAKELLALIKDGAGAAGKKIALSPSLLIRDSSKRREFIERGELNPRDFYSHVLPVERIQEAISLIRGRRAQKVILTM